MIIREVRESDAEDLVQLIKQVEAESQYMLMEPGERQVTAEQQKQRIESIRKSANSNLFIAEENCQLAGYLFAIGGTAKRNKHSVYIVIRIRKEYRGLGVGTRLFERLEEWAVNHKIVRLELTTVTQNVAGVALYKKMGFEIEGTKKNSLLIDGEFVDEYYMAKVL